MKQGLYKIVSNEALTGSVYRMVLEGDTSAITAPGQFVNIKLDGMFLRRPISVCDYSGTTITLIYKTVGTGTEAMSELPVGAVLDVLIGLGNGYDTAKSGDAPLLIGGGVGVPPMYRLCKELIAEGKHPRVILGFNTAEEIFYEEEFRNLFRQAERLKDTEGKDALLKRDGEEALRSGGAAKAEFGGLNGAAKTEIAGLNEAAKAELGGLNGAAKAELGGLNGAAKAELAGLNGAAKVEITGQDETQTENSGPVYIATADGSVGVKGFVTDVMKQINDYTYFYTCGPLPMFRAIESVAQTSGQYSFEERMGCGFGACMGCSCKTKYGSKRICKDGPVLEREEIIW